MSDNPTEETATEEPTPTPEPAQEPDWKAEARKWEKRAKENTDAAARLAELEDAQKSEHQKLQEQLDQERLQGRQAAVEAARYRAAMKHGLAEEDLDLLGDDPEQIEARAERFAARLAAAAPEPVPHQRRPQERLKPGATPDGEPQATPQEIAAALFKNR